MIWDVNSWAVGQVSAHSISKARGEVVRVVVGLSRESRYSVRASGKDVLVEVTAKTAPPKPTASGLDAAALKRAEEANANARQAAAAELAQAKAEAKRIREQAAQRDVEAKARIAQAERLMEEAKARSAEAQESSRLAKSEIAAAAKRQALAEAAETSANQRKAALAKAEKDALAATSMANEARARNSTNSSKLQLRAEAATRSAEKRRKEAEKAFQLAEKRRIASEKATRQADAKRIAAAAALEKALAERKRAEVRRDQAIALGGAATSKQETAESAAREAAKRAHELQEMVRAEELRFAAARDLRKQEEDATAKARTAHQRAEESRMTALAAQDKLASEIKRLSKAQQDAKSRRLSAEKALAISKRAAADSRVSLAERNRLASEAKSLGLARDKADKVLRKHELSIDAHRAQVAQLNTKRAQALKGLSTLETRANQARERRAAEEKKLLALSSKRAKLQGQLDDARTMRLAAKSELERARKDREQAQALRQKAEKQHLLAENQRKEADKLTLAAQEARNRALAAEDQVQRELELAKRARLAAETARENTSFEIEEAKRQEIAAAQRLKASQRAQNDRKASAAAIAKAKTMERAAKEALKAARAERLLAEKERAKGEAALKLANTREMQAAKKLALANKSKSVPAIAKARPTTRLSDLDVVQSQGLSRVVIAMSSPAKPRVVSNRGNEAVLEIPNAAIRNDQERTLDTSSLRGSVKAVSSYRDPKNPNNLKIVVDLAQASKGVLKKIGNTYYWEFPQAAKAASSVAQSKKRSTQSTSYQTQAVAGYGSASSPITQQTVAQLKNRRRKTYRGQKIDLDYKKSDIHDLMRLLADVGGVNIIIPDDINARVTIRLRRVPWDQALDVILASKGLGYKMEGPGLFRIARRKELDAEFEAKLLRAKAMADSEAPQPEVFNLNYVLANDVRKQLASLLSPKGSLQVDTRSNALIINDVSRNRGRIIDMLRRLDTQTPQIQIEARIVEARSTFVREFGIQWGGNMAASAATGNATGLIFPNSIGLAGAAEDGQTPNAGVGASPSDFAVNLPAAIGTGSGGGIGLSLGSVGGALGLNLRLSALEDEGSVRIISSPKITTSNNTQASIKSGVSIPISVVSANGVQTQFVPADLELKVKPSVSLRDCAVSMDIDVKKNEADFVNTGARGDPTLLTKEAKTTILVQDGDTSVIGGIYTRNSGVAYSKVPFFGDLPVLGWLFKTTKENDERTEVLIFITPKITNRASLPCSDQ